jgi:hypothetical protein
MVWSRSCFAVTAKSAGDLRLLDPRRSRSLIAIVPSAISNPCGETGIDVAMPIRAVCSIGRLPLLDPSGPTFAHCDAREGPSHTSVSSQPGRHVITYRITRFMELSLPTDRCLSGGSGLGTGIMRRPLEELLSANSALRQLTCLRRKIAEPAKR